MLERSIAPNVLSFFIYSFTSKCSVHLADKSWLKVLLVLGEKKNCSLAEKSTAYKRSEKSEEDVPWRSKRML